MNRVTVRQQQVLEALADYHYLVPAQMVRLGLSQSTGAMRRTLRRFEFELPGSAGNMLGNPRSASVPSGRGSTGKRGASPACFT